MAPNAIALTPLTLELEFSTKTLLALAVPAVTDVK